MMSKNDMSVEEIPKPTALIKAFMSPYNGVEFKLIEKLIQHCDVNLQYDNVNAKRPYVDGMTALHLACLFSNTTLEIIECLIKNNDEETALHCACRGACSVDVLKFLIENGADPTI